VLKNPAIVARNLFYCNRIFNRRILKFKGLERGLKSARGTDDKHVVANMLLRIGGAFLGCLACLVLHGCGGSDFDPNGILESRPVQLDQEQVILDPSQVDCGAQEDLWTVTPMGTGRAIARLTQKGRNLQFSDDVQIGDPVIGAPYVQIHGSFPIKVIKMGSVHDEDDYTRLVDAKVGVTVDNTCFRDAPLVLLGVRHGQFDQSANPVFRLKLDHDWLVDQTVH
jgi:hypothetical protein